MLTASDIIAFAERQGFKLARDGCGKLSDRMDGCACPRRVLANEVTESESMYRKETVEAIQAKFGLTQDDQSALEEGFEGWKDADKKYCGNKYYKLGKKLARLVN